MPSTKKRRGKQRKAAARAAAAARNEQGYQDRRITSSAAPHPVTMAGVPAGLADFAIKPDFILDQIRRGEEFGTEFVTFRLNDIVTGKGSHGEFEFIEKLVDGGMVDTLLGFLGQCKRASLDAVTVEPQLQTHPPIDAYTASLHWRRGATTNVKKRPIDLPNDVYHISEVEWADDIAPREPSTLCMVKASEKAPRPKQKRPEPCFCEPDLDTEAPCCIDTSCALFACHEECTGACPAGQLCGNKRIQHKMCKKLSLFDAGMKGRGLMTQERCRRGDFIVEYVGVAVRRRCLDNLLSRYKHEKELYILALDDDVYLDARHRGGISRYLNHSCEPNCAVHRWKVNGIARAGIFALREIEVGEELSFDYQWERMSGRALSKCYCGSQNCRGTIESEAHSGRNRTEPSRSYREVASNPLKEPSHWIGILSNILVHNSDETRIRIARGMGPIISCMRSPKRTFFKSIQHWHTVVYPFLGLVRNILVTGETVEILINHKGLIDLLVQAVFWQSCRPDIVREWEMHDKKFCFQEVMHVAVDSLIVIMGTSREKIGTQAYLGDLETRRAYHIGTTSIISESYDAVGSVPFVVGIIDRLLQQPKLDPSPTPGTYLSILRRLVQAGCVDKDVISGVISISASFDYGNSVNLINIMMQMFMHGAQAFPDDNRFAFAIDQGLIEKSLEILNQYKSARSDHLIDNLQKLFEGVYVVAVGTKSGKSIHNRRQDLLELIQKTDTALEESREKYKTALQTVKIFVGLKADIEDYIRDICWYCGKNAEEFKNRECSRCMAIYCSHECQEEHEQEIHCAASTANACYEVRAMQKALKREKMLELNVSAVAEKLVNENHLNIVAQATLQGHDVLDCIVLLDLTVLPTIEVKPASNFLSSVLSSDEKSYLQQTFERNRPQGGLTSISYYLSTQTSGHDSITRLDLIKTHHHSWQDTQASYKMSGWLTMVTMYGDSKLRETALGVFFCDWYDRIWTKHEEYHAKCTEKKQKQQERARIQNEIDRKRSAQLGFEAKLRKLLGEQRERTKGIMMTSLFCRAMPVMQQMAKQGVHPKEVRKKFEENHGVQDIFDEFEEELELDSDDISLIEEVREELSEKLRMWEDNFAEQILKEMKLDKVMAEILGVEPDADKRSITVVYQKLVLKYHPDNWSSDSELTKEEAQDLFQSIQGAYDHLLSRFEYDDDGHDDESLY